MEKKMMNRKWISFFPLQYAAAGLFLFLLTGSFAAAEGRVPYPNYSNQTNPSVTFVAAEPLILDGSAGSISDSSTSNLVDDPQNTVQPVPNPPLPAAGQQPEPLSDLISESLPENPSDFAVPAADDAPSNTAQSAAAELSAVPEPEKPQNTPPAQPIDNSVPPANFQQPPAPQQPLLPGTVPPNGPQPNGPQSGGRQPNGPQPGGPAPMVVVVPQENNTPDEEAPAAVSADPATAQLAAHLRTPRLVFKYLLNLVGEYNQYEEASKALDFSDMPDISDKRKKELAYDLYMVIWRLSDPDPELIPNDKTLKTYAYQPNKDFEPLYLVNKGGMFLFSPDTVSKLSDMYKKMQDLRPKFADEYWPFNLMSDWWFKSIFGLRRVQWAAIGVFLVWGYFLGWLISKVLYYLTLTTFHIMSSDLTEYKISKQTWRPIGWLLMYSTWFWGIVGIQAPPKMIEIVGFPIHVLAVSMVIISGIRLINILSIWGRKKVSGTKSKLDEILIPLLSRSLKILLIVVGVGIILQALGFSAVGIVSGMGIGGIAIALAAQNTIANLFGSITVMIDRPFVIGDWIVTGDIEGTVEAVGLRSTRIRTHYDSLVTVPNNVLTTAVIDNMGRRHFRRYKTTLGVQYDTPPDRIEAFCEGIRELILSYNFTRKDVFHVYANEFSASSIDILLNCFFLVPDTSAERRAKSIFILDILRLAEKMDIRFAFPSQTIYNVATEDKGYEDPLLPSDEFGKASAAGIIEKRIAKERARRSAAVHGELEEEIAAIEEMRVLDKAGYSASGHSAAGHSDETGPSEKPLSSFPADADKLRSRRFFRRAS